MGSNNNRRRWMKQQRQRANRQLIQTQQPVVSEFPPTIAAVPRIEVNPINEPSEIERPSEPVVEAHNELTTERDTVAVWKISDVCAFLRVSRSTIDRMTKTGKLPGRFEVNGQVRFVCAQIVAWMNNGGTMKSGNDT